MPVLMFAPRFHDPVSTGAKCQTIRGPRKRPIPPGAPLSLRAWTGTPYRSPQRVLREALCLSVEPIAIHFSTSIFTGLPTVNVEISGVLLYRPIVEEFVRADGFAGLDDFRQWWAANRITPFEGILIRWAPLCPQALPGETPIPGG